MRAKWKLGDNQIHPPAEKEQPEVQAVVGAMFELAMLI